MKQYRPLIMRTNRFMGSVLTDNNLIKIEELEQANAKLLEYMQAEEFKNANLLNILINDLKVLDESALIELIKEEHDVGLVDLANYEFPHFHDYHIDLNLCWATFTIPFDKVEDFYFIATTYYLSKPTMKYWEDQIDGHITWYATSLMSIFNALGKVSQLVEEASKEETAAEQ